MISYRRSEEHKTTDYKAGYHTTLQAIVPACTVSSILYDLSRLMLQSTTSDRSHFSLLYSILPHAIEYIYYNKILLRSAIRLFSSLYNDSIKPHRTMMLIQTSLDSS